MNQILLTENYKNTNKNSKNNGNNNYDIKKIILFFAIAILILGIAIISVYGYKIFTNKNKEDESAQKPQVSLVEESESDVIIIKAEAEAGISKIVYTWNDEEPNEIDMNGRTSHEEQLEIPNGENKLNVKIIDNNGDEIESTKEFTKISTQGPTIEAEVVEYDKLKITATDETAMKYIKYRWNDEEDTIVKAESVNETFIETITELRDGTNRITITAVDSDGNEEVFTNPYMLLRRPSIDVSQQDGELYMKIFHEKGFEKVEFSVNGKIYKYDENYSGYDETTKELEYKFSLQEGENTVIILAVSNEGTERTYKGKCQYTLEQ